MFPPDGTAADDSGGMKIVANVEAGELIDAGRGCWQPSKLSERICTPRKSMHCPIRIAVALSLHV